MSDRRPEKLYVRGTLMGFKDNTDIGVQFREATPAEALAFVRRGVESGTIKGKELGWCDTHNQRANMVIEKPACYHRLGCRVSQRLVLPVSDGGSET